MHTNHTNSVYNLFIRKVLEEFEKVKMIEILLKQKNIEWENEKG